LASVPVTVYVVVAEGEAVTLDPVDDDNPVEGVQVYVDAPETDKAKALPPEQYVPLFTDKLGKLLTFTVTELVELAELLSVKVNVYVFVDVGEIEKDDAVLTIVVPSLQE
jgi:hypothetical protein